MRTTTGPARITVLELDPGRAITVWRIVRSDNPDDPVFLNSLRSHYELGDDPRGVERSSAIIYMGISAYVDEAAAHGTAQKWDKLGDFIAEIRLRAGNGFNFAHTGQPLHLTIWGHPVKLQDAVVDIQPVWG